MSEDYDNNPIITGGMIGNYGYLISEQNQSYAIGVMTGGTGWVNPDIRLQTYGNLLIDPSFFADLTTSPAKSRTITLKNGNYIEIGYDGDYDPDKNFTGRVYVKAFDTHKTVGNQQIITANDYASQHVGELCFVFPVLTPDLYNKDSGHYAGIIMIWAQSLPLENSIIRSGKYDLGFTSKDSWDDFVNGSYSDIKYDGDDSSTGGFDGDFDNNSDNVPVPQPPSVLADTFYNIYKPTETQLIQFAYYLWQPDFLDSLLRLHNDPIENIINLAVTYVPLPDDYTSKAMYVGNLSTGIEAPAVSDRFVQIEFGYLDINEYWGNFLDYNPYTKIEIFLPYIGFRQLDTDDVMNNRIELTYNIDLLTGACVAFIKTINHDVKSVLYNFEGNTFTNIPLSASSVADLYASLGVGFATALVTGSAAVGTMISVSSLAKPTKAQMNDFNNAKSALGSQGNQLLDTVMQKTHVPRTSRADSSFGMMGIKTPYLVIHRPVTSKPTDYNKIIGYPSNVTMSLGSLSGYTVVESVHLENIPATDAELSMIDNLLNGGVIL